MKSDKIFAIFNISRLPERLPNNITILHILNVNCFGCVLIYAWNAQRHVRFAFILKCVQQREHIFSGVCTYVWKKSKKKHGSRICSRYELRITVLLEGFELCVNKFTITPHTHTHFLLIYDVRKWKRFADYTFHRIFTRTHRHTHVPLFALLSCSFIRALASESGSSLLCYCSTQRVRCDMVEP